ncbi:DUF4926 domain-containing protein [Leptolyngbya boryana CZ1]|uniref:DUF4926 domain-containing protein n=1 Tax=Leptolyngbya boryana CZ1 TaxID=3060204 RepID=A0AA96WP44_LEPBY|nr:DUF4926 domain-containing protein [Leptolyngbya boryana]WNZ43322.1 DUF4926 domain-containing protein [Leptolyngbya boryana CZ1]
MQSALNIGVAEADELRGALRQATLAVSALQRATQDVIPVEQNAYGQKYRPDFEMVRSEKQATIRSVWIVRQNEDFPKLVTCDVLSAIEANPMKLLNVVALIKDLPEQNLCKGQVGTIVEVYEPEVFEVEFVDLQGHTYAVETLQADALMQLHYVPTPQVA